MRRLETVLWRSRWLTSDFFPLISPFSESERRAPLASYRIAYIGRCGDLSDIGERQLEFNVVLHDAHSGLQSVIRSS